MALMGHNNKYVKPSQDAPIEILWIRLRRAYDSMHNSSRAQGPCIKINKHQPSLWLNTAHECIGQMLTKRRQS